MYMSYFKRPELVIFDEDECQEFLHTQCKDFWHQFEARESAYYRDGELNTNPRDNKLSLVMVSSQLNSEVANGVYAEHVKNIYYLSQPFTTAMEKCIDKLMPLVEDDDIYYRIHEDCCLIYGDQTIVFMSLKDDNVRLLQIQEGCIAAITDFKLTKEGISNIETLTVLDLEYTIDEAGIVREGELGEWNTDKMRIECFYLILLFKKYGNINVETIAAKKALRMSQILGEKVNNFMGIDVQVLDSRWFTTICRDEGFLVSGHFRLQPKKDENGEWTRELIYIKPYAKHGYHRLAPVVNLNQEDG